MAITLGVLVFAATSAVLIWALASRGRGAGDPEEPKRTPFWQRILAGLFILLLFGTVLALVRKGKPPLHLPSAAGVAHPHSSKPGHSAVHFIPAASISTIGVVALVLATLFIWSFVSARRHRHRQGWNLSGLIFGTNEVTPLATTQSPETLAGSLATVRVPNPEEETDPRRAVVAAYLAMNHAAAAAGARRRVDETPSEFLQRLLDSLGASHAAARSLTVLFETARYSTKPFEETRRSDAITALRQIRAELSLGMVGTAL